MKLEDILSSEDSYKKRKRLGRGTGSGHGKTSGRGHKGLGARSGSGIRLGYEGGQNPTIARTPKRGFSNAGFRHDYQVVNISSLEVFKNGDKVDSAAMLQAGLIEAADKPVKILGNGELSKKLTVVAAKFSASASEKIQKVGGAVEKA